MRLVSSELGNTPTICRASYVHPMVIARYVDDGETIPLPKARCSAANRGRHSAFGGRAGAGRVSRPAFSAIDAESVQPKGGSCSGRRLSTIRAESYVSAHGTRGDRSVGALVGRRRRSADHRSAPCSAGRARTCMAIFARWRMFTTLSQHALPSPARSGGA